MARRIETDPPTVGRPSAAVLVGTLFLMTLVLELALAFLNPSEAIARGDGGTGGLGLIPFFVLGTLMILFGVFTMLTAGAAMGKRGTLARLFAILLFAGAALRLVWPMWVQMVTVFDAGTGGGGTSIEPVIAFTTGEGSFLVSYIAAATVLLGVLGLLTFGTRPSRRIRRLVGERESALAEARDARRRSEAPRSDERAAHGFAADGRAADGFAADGGADHDGAPHGDERDPREIDRDERTRAARESIRDERDIRSDHALR